VSQSEFSQQLNPWVIVEVFRDFSGIRCAVERGDMAASEEIGEVGSEMHEDCLSLRIFRNQNSSVFSTGLDL
jgi:hypothetical protein